MLLFPPSSPNSARYPVGKHNSTDCISMTVPLVVATCRVDTDASFHPDDHFPASPPFRHQFPSVSIVDDKNNNNKQDTGQLVRYKGFSDRY